MNFNPSHLDLFSRVSGDVNPLHLDDEYARLSQLSRPIVFGAALVLRALSQWAQGQSFSLRNLKAEFRQPAFTDQDYDLEIIRQDAIVRATFRLEKTLIAEIEWTAAPGVPQDWPEPPAQPSEKDYAPDSTVLPELLSLYGLSKNQMPWHQLLAVFWSSYFVGMKNPGKQALYSALEFDFAGTSSSYHLALHSLSAEEDERFSLVTIQGKGDGISNFVLRAFRRPEAVRTLAPQAQPQGKSPLAGQSVFISGASRGFGAALAQAFGRHGARIFLNYRVCWNEAERVAHVLKQSEVSCWLVQGDVSNPTDCERMGAFIRRKTGSLDILVNNAALKAKPFPGELTGNYMEKSLAMAAIPSQHFASIMSPDPLVIFISSIYIKKPEAGFETYIEAKRKVEEFARAFAKTGQNKTVIVARPPRLRIQQGFALQSTVESADPARIAGELVGKVAGFRSPLQPLMPFTVLEF